VVAGLKTGGCPPVKVNFETKAVEKLPEFSTAFLFEPIKHRKKAVEDSTAFFNFDEKESSPCIPPNMKRFKN